MKQLLSIINSFLAFLARPFNTLYEQFCLERTLEIDEVIANTVEECRRDYAEACRNARVNCAVFKLTKSRIERLRIDAVREWKHISREASIRGLRAEIRGLYRHQKQAYLGACRTKSKRTID